MSRISFRNIVFLSICLHVLFLIWFFINDRQSSDTDAPIPRPYQRVDMVELPNFVRARVTPEIPKPAVVPPPPKSEVAEKKQEPAPGPSAKDKKINLNKLNQAFAKEDAFKKLNELNKPKDNLNYGGNILSKGDSTVGEQTNRYIVLYQRQLERTIKSNWAFPPFLKKWKQFPVFNIKINEYGYITFKLIKSSGNDLLDTSAIEAIEKSNPIDPPEPDVIYKLKTEGLVVSFAP